MSGELNFRRIAHVLGSLLMLEGALILLSALMSLFYPDESGAEFLYYSAGIALVTGGLFWYSTRSCSEQIGKREGYLIASLVWVVYSFFGALPFWLGGYIPSFTDAFFEAMSGLTTTGASMLADVESLPHALLFWRSMTHLIGGLGILFLLIVILPVYGSGNMVLYQAESSGAFYGEKVSPRIADLAKRLFWIYIGLNVLLIFILYVLGMPLFDASCHAFGTLATGGFSVKNASIGAYSNPIQFVIASFTLLGGINFTLFYFLLLRRFSKVWHDDELRFFLFTVAAAVLVVFGSLFSSGITPSDAFRYAYFHVASFITSTGFVVGNHTAWPPLAAFILLAVMVTGACAGSTCGGVKSVRVLLLWRAIPAQIKKILHPRAVYIVRLNDSKVNEELLFKVLSFTVLYVVAIGLGTAALLMMGVDHVTALSGVVSAIGNVGAAFGSVAGNFGGLPDAAKWVLTFLMLLGRLELFSVMVLFTSGFWKDN